MIALLDTTVLSNFTIVARPDLVQAVLGQDATTTEAAWGELQAGIRIGRLAPCDWSWMPVLSLAPEEEAVYESFLRPVNAGEASCLAIALKRQGRVFTDDRDARELAGRWRIPVSGTLGLLVALIDRSLLPLAEADALLARMIAAGYRAPVGSLAELLR